MKLRTLLMSLLLITAFIPIHAEAPKPTGFHPLEITTQNGVRKFEVELADTQEKRTQGLMHRKSLEKSKGMLFVFDTDNVHSFWMKNTHIPLDLIFLDKDKKVVGLLKNMKPFSTESRSIGKPSRYVLEINAGLIDKHKIVVGDLVSFENRGGL